MQNISSVSQKYNFLSLFCGCGGFDLGFINAGFKCMGAYDIDPIATNVHKLNINSPVFIYDLSTYKLPHSVNNVDVIIAGPPCQGFSTAGRRRLDDPRNELLITAAKIAINIKPKVFLIENVSGVKAGEHSKYWDSLQLLLRNSGYRTAELRCDVSKMGIAQSRTRMLLIAWSNGKNPQITIPSTQPVALRDVLTNIHNVVNHDVKLLPKDSNTALIAKHIKAGQKLCNVRGGVNSVHTWDIPRVFGVTTRKERALLESMIYFRRRYRTREYGDADPVSLSILTKHHGRSVKALLTSLEAKDYIRKIDGKYDLKNTFNGKYRRLRWDKPSYTVDTRFGDPKYFLHPSCNRGFTVREAARIQGFPDNFIFYGSQRDQYRMIGNAVPPPLGMFLAGFIKEGLLS